MSKASSIKDYIKTGDFYQAVVEDGADIIFIVDYEGVIHYHNPSVKTFLGYEIGELIGKNFISFNHSSYQESLTERFKQLSTQKYADNIEFYFRKKNGEFTYLEFNSINLQHKDQVAALLLDCRDISQRKKDAEELVKAQKAKELFLANMSHEIRTPISGIAGMVSLLESSERNAEEKKYLDAIKHSAEHLKVIINDILDFAAIEAGKLTFESIGFKPYDEVQKVVDSFELSINEKGLNFEFKFNGDENLIVKGDPVRLNQVLVNLINNAIKFTHKGKITLEIKFENKEKFSLLSFCVKDTGIGIPEDKKKNLFESFSQADASINRRFGGTGLGLSISKHIVNHLGGKIWLESELNKGSNFCFEIPYEIGSNSDLASDPGEESSSTSPLEGVKILLAEDNDINKLYTCKVLEDIGCKAHAVENGKACVEALKQQTFDLILMDLQMPLMDGFQATAEIRNSFPEPAKSIPIVALTANAIKGDQEKCIEAGMNDYLTKPFTPENLNKILKKWLVNSGQESGTNEKDSNKEGKEALVDLNYLKEICNNDEKFISEMISTFISSTPEMISKLQQALKEMDINTISKVAHKLKPSVTFMGLASLNNIVPEIENIKSEPVPEDYDSKVNEVINSLKKAIEELEALS